MALMECPNCKGKISEYAEKCPHCGYDIKKCKTVKCPECDGAIDVESKTCPHCGCPVTICPDCGTVYIGSVDVCSECGCNIGKIAVAAENKRVATADNSAHNDSGNRTAVTNYSGNAHTATADNKQAAPANYAPREVNRPVAPVAPVANKPLNATNSQANYQTKSYANSIPDKYKPLSPWAYFGYMILYCIPIIGFICLIIFALNGNNINRRSHARSYFCVYIIAIVFVILIMIIGGASASALLSSSVT